MIPLDQPFKLVLLYGNSCFLEIGIPIVAGSWFLTANFVNLDSIQP